MTRLLLFDSGIGGLSVAREVRRASPDAEMIYVADDAGFPYGNLEESVLTERVVGLLAVLISRYEPDAVVIACNTASTLVLPELRERFSIPFVGTVPAVKPAAALTRSGLISVLATPGTMRRDYTRELIGSFASHCQVRLVGCPNLAFLAETRMRAEPLDDDAVRAEMHPAFVEQAGGKTDVVVLACTHYPFLAEDLERLAPWPVTWIDPAPAIAQRVLAVAGNQGTGGGAALLLSGAGWHPALIPVLARLGLEPEREDQI
ncbi:MAG: glutamate racemase [Hyphomicrobiales bacterium]|nr:glutamate racemase [Hyphomicrobiales bacterium]